MFTDAAYTKCFFNVLSLLILGWKKQVIDLLFSTKQGSYVSVKQDVSRAEVMRLQHAQTERKDK